MRKCRETALIVSIGPGKVEVPFREDTVKLGGAQDPVQRILRIDNLRGSWALAASIAGRQFVL